MPSIGSSQFATGFREKVGKKNTKIREASDCFLAPTALPMKGQLLVLIVADSVDTEKGVENFGSIAVNASKNYFLSKPTSDPCQALSNAIVAADNAIRAKKQSYSDLGEIGSTLVIALLTLDRVFVASIGDSRAYLIHNRQIKQVTIDHTWLQEALDAGRITREEARVHPNRRVLKRYLGMNEQIISDILPSHGVDSGDCIILCTDGLCDYLDEEQIKLIASDSEPQRSTNRLLDQAIKQGAQDDITVRIVQWSKVLDRRTLENRRQYSDKKPLEIIRGEPTKNLEIKNAKLGLEKILLPLLTIIALCLLGFVGIISVAPRVFLQNAQPTPVQIAKPMLARTSISVPNLPSLVIATVTPVPTFTPLPTVFSWSAPLSPILREPVDGSVFDGPNTEVMLSWEPVGFLPQDIYYVATIRKSIGDNLIFESQNWTRETKIKLDASFYYKQAYLQNFQIASVNHVQFPNMDIRQLAFQKPTNPPPPKHTPKPPPPPPATNPPPPTNIPPETNPPLPTNPALTKPPPTAPGTLAPPRTALPTQGSEMLTPLPSKEGSGDRPGPTPPVVIPNRFEWFVTMFRATYNDAEGTLNGEPISAPSITRTFYWGSTRW